MCMYCCISYLTIQALKAILTPLTKHISNATLAN